MTRSRSSRPSATRSSVCRIATPTTCFLQERRLAVLLAFKRFDSQQGTAVRYEYGEGRYGSEPQMARAVGATREDDGYVLTFVTDMNENLSECF